MAAIVIFSIYLIKNLLQLNREIARELNNHLVELFSLDRILIKHTRSSKNYFAIFH